MVVFRLAMAATFLTVTLVIGFGIAWIFSGRLIRPLRQLGRDASLLASGELSHRSAVRSQDELGTLADDFNRMATALERRASEAHGAADELRQAKDTLAAVIDASPVAIVCCDLQRKTMLWNRTAEEMFGYAAEEVIGLPSRLTPPEAAAESQRLFERAASGETIRNLEGQRLRKDGTAGPGQGRGRADVQSRRHACAASRAPTRTSPTASGRRSSSSGSLIMIR